MVAAPARRQWLRPAACAVALLGAAGAVWGFLAARSWDRRFQAWLVAEPARARIDLSVPGEHTLAFEQDCSIAHSQSLVVPAGSWPDAEDAAAALRGLLGSLAVRDAEGRVVGESPVSPTPWGVNGEPAVRLAEIIPPPRGRYTLVLRLESGAAAAGGPRMVSVRNDLCGMERMPALVYRAVGAGAGVVAAVAAVVALMPRGRGTAGRAQDPAGS